LLKENKKVALSFVEAKVVAGLLNFSEFWIPGLEKRAADLVGFGRAVASVPQFGRAVMKRVESG